MSLLTDMLKRHEGAKKDANGRHRLYKDTVEKWTCGYGRNASDVGFSEDEVELMLTNDIARVIRELDEALPWWMKLDGVRRDALIDLGFNLGVLTPPETAKLLTFKNTLKCLEEGRYEDAANNLVKSKWYEQVKERGVEIVAMMRTGEYL